MSTQQDWTFEQALACKPRSKAHLTDAQWYVAVVAVCTKNYTGINPGSFCFTMTPPNPEIQACFDARMAPHLAAAKLFSVRH